MNQKIEIKNDVFDIADRLREIDDGYFVLYNAKSEKFEIHNKRQKHDTLALILPYDTLDCRAIDYVLSTRLASVMEKIKQLDCENEKIYENKKRQLMKDFSDVGKDLSTPFST